MTLPESKSSLVPTPGNPESSSVAAYYPEQVEFRDSDEKQAVNPLLVAHLMLKGRYVIAICVALVGAVGGAIAGYMLTSPKYKSSGMIRIEPSAQRILYQNEQNTVMPLFDSFVDAQASMLQSQRVVDLAMDSSDWKALGRPLTADSEDQFVKSLTILHDPHSEVVAVEFLDNNPAAAQAAVKSVIEAYQKLYKENDADSGSQRMQILEDRRTSLNNDLKALNDRIESVANVYGSESLGTLYEFKQEQLNRLDDELQQAQITAASLPAAGSTDAHGTKQSASDDNAALIADASLLADPAGRQLLLDRWNLQSHIALLKHQYGGQYPELQSAERQAEQLDHEIAEYQQMQSAVPQNTNGLPRVPTKVQAEEYVKNLSSLRDIAGTKTVAIGRTNLELASLKDDAETVQKHLQETKDRIEQLSLESSANGRISVLSDGDQPLRPFKDRRIGLAAAGAMGMAGFGVGLVILAGFVDRRIRHLSDPRVNLRKRTQVLGVLPALPKGPVLPEERAIASYGVHLVRALLEAGSERRGGTFAITSGSAGAGKTSLSVALGLSLAASGSRTLVIDADIIGRGMTSRVRQLRHRRIGQIIAREGFAAKDQLVSAIKEATETQRRTGEVLVASGVVNQSQLDQALSKQKASALGLTDALRGERLENCICPVGNTRLHVLPVGNATIRHVGQLSRSAVRDLLERAKEKYDYVLVDTGPILGSLEASIVCREVDKVILAVACGDDGVTVERSLSYLEKSGATIAGMVFNRARPEEVELSNYSSSNIRSNPTSHRSLPFADAASHESDPASIEHIGSHLELGPLGLAVAMQTELLRPKARSRKA